MGRKRLLLPFTYGVDAPALEHVMRFARASQITPVALVLIPSSQEQSAAGARPERIQQAKDFLELVQTKAQFAEVPLERHEAYTTHITSQILCSARELECQGILLLFRSEEPCLLQKEEIAALQQVSPFPFYILQVQPEHKQGGLGRLLRPRSNERPPRKSLPSTMFEERAL